MLLPPFGVTLEALPIGPVTLELAACTAAVIEVTRQPTLVVLAPPTTAVGMLPLGSTAPSPPARKEHVETPPLPQRQCLTADPAHRLLDTEAEEHAGEDQKRPGVA